MLVKQKVKYIQTLGQKKFREEEKVFIAEGPKLVKELLQEYASGIKEVFAVNDWIGDNKTLPGGISITEITEAELERISQLSTANKVLAIVQQFPNVAPLVKGTITLALDGIRDPGNLGTIIRTADWFGITQIVCSNDSADIYNTKVVQATMGSIARVKVFYTDLDEWLAAQKDTRIYAAVLEGQDITSEKKLKEGILVIGNESNGIGESILDLVNVKVTIPRKGKAESLNAAIATAVILSHLV